MTLAPSLPRTPAASPVLTDPVSVDAFVDELKKHCRGEVLTGRTLRGIYSTDASLYQQFPRAVLVPLDEADVAAAVKVCNTHDVPVTPRGGATSLSGQTFGPGLILDFSKHMDAVISVDAEAGTAVVQPGVVRDRLNAQVADYGLHLSPDPATGSRATVGGMIGNNTCGTRSVVYGKTIDSVISLRCVLADGTIADMAPCDDETWQARARGEGVTETEAKLYRGVRDVVLKHQDAIRTGYPEVLRRVSGYNLDEFVDGSGYTGDIGPRREHNQGARTWNLANLLVGSEGTLGLITEATVHLEKLPKATALVIVHFDTLDASLRHVDAMLEHKPSTVELLDDIVIREARVNPSTKAMCNFVDGDPAAVQLVEFFGETPEEAADRAEKFAKDMAVRGIGYAHPIRTDPKGMADVWNTRKLGLGLISNNYGPLKGKGLHRGRVRPDPPPRGLHPEDPEALPRQRHRPARALRARLGGRRPRGSRPRPAPRRPGGDDGTGRRAGLRVGDGVRRELVRRARRRTAARAVPAEDVRRGAVRGLPRDQDAVRPDTT